MVVEGEEGKQVIVDGTVELNAVWTDSDNDGIYEATIDMGALSERANAPVETIHGVFVKGGDDSGYRYMIPALPMNVKNPTDPTNGNPHNPEPGTVWAWNREVHKLTGPDDEEQDVFINPDNHENWATGTLDNLDSEEEWAFEQDQQTITLYLKASKGFIPDQTNVRVRIRDRNVKIQDSDNFTLKNLHFFAGSLDLPDCDYLTVEDLSLIHI